MYVRIEAKRLGGERQDSRTGQQARALNPGLQPVGRKAKG